MSENAPVQIFRTHDFVLDCGTTLPELVVAYQTYGKLIDNDGVKRRVILVSTCFIEALSARNNPLIGPGKALDPDEYYIVRVNLLGGSESSSPSNTPAPYSGQNFPHVTYSDNVRAHVTLLQSIGVDVKSDGLYAVVGFSMGGQLAYHWGALHVDYVQHIICIATSARTSQHNIAFLEGPKAALHSSGSYGRNTIGPKAFGHAYCAWAYSHDWFEERKWEETGASNMMDFMAKQWSNANWDGWDLLALTWMWHHSDLAIVTHEAGGKPLYSSYDEALAGIHCKALIMPTRTDLYFVSEDSEREVKQLSQGKLSIVETIYGHMGGGGWGTREDNEFIDSEVRSFLQS